MEKLTPNMFPTSLQWTKQNICTNGIFTVHQLKPNSRLIFRPIGEIIIKQVDENNQEQLLQWIIHHPMLCQKYNIQANENEVQEIMHEIKIRLQCLISASIEERTFKDLCNKLPQKQHSNFILHEHLILGITTYISKCSIIGQCVLFVCSARKLGTIQSLAKQYKEIDQLNGKESEIVFHSPPPASPDSELSGINLNEDKEENETVHSAMKTMVVQEGSVQSSNAAPTAKNNKKSDTNSYCKYLFYNLLYRCSISVYHFIIQLLMVCKSLQVFVLCNLLRSIHSFIRLARPFPNLLLMPVMMMMMISPAGHPCLTLV